MEPWLAGAIFGGVVSGLAVLVLELAVRLAVARRRRFAARNTMAAHAYSNHVAHLSHDLAHVFTTITLLADHTKRCETRDLTLYRQIVDAARQGMRTLDLSRFVSPEVCPQSLPLRPHSLTAIRNAVAEVVDHYRSGHGNIDLDLDTQLDNKMVFSVDLRSFREAISNILDNALKYNSGNRPVRISVILTQLGETAIQVTNQAEPPKENFNRWLEAYWRGHNAARRTVGHGIGLTIASIIAKLHNAKLTGHVREDVVAVTFTLPAPNKQRGL